MTQFYIGKNTVDYCNAQLSGLPKKGISNLQLLQNPATQVLMRTSFFKFAALAGCMLQEHF